MVLSQAVKTRWFIVLIMAGSRLCDSEYHRNRDNFIISSKVRNYGKYTVAEILEMKYGKVASYFAAVIIILAFVGDCLVSISRTWLCITCFNRYFSRTRYYYCGSDYYFTCDYGRFDVSRTNRCVKCVLNYDSVDHRSTCRNCGRRRLGYYFYRMYRKHI